MNSKASLSTSQYSINSLYKHQHAAKMWLNKLPRRKKNYLLHRSAAATANCLILLCLQPRQAFTSAGENLQMQMEMQRFAGDETEAGGSGTSAVIKAYLAPQSRHPRRTRHKQYNIIHVPALAHTIVSLTSERSWHLVWSCWYNKMSLC